MNDTLFAKNLNGLPSVRHAFFTRAWGNSWFSDGVERQEALRSREHMAEFFGIAPQNFLGCHQIHSQRVVTVEEAWTSENAPEADAMVTNKPGIALGIFTADCVPVMLASSTVPIIGAAHAGWRGAVGGILEKTLEAMEKLGAQRKDIYAALGPCIWQASYEVGPDFPNSFLAESASNERFFSPSIKQGHFQFDLPGYVAAKLQNLGLASVEPSPADTCADPDRFFSHRWSSLRGEKRKGSLISAIILK